MNNQVALKHFKLAIEKFYKKKFSRAEKLMEQYSKDIDYTLFDRLDNRDIKNPLVSVIIVAYQTNQLLLNCLYSFSDQIETSFEIIVVDNGGNKQIQEELRHLNILHIKCPCNFFLSEGRNIGFYFSQGKIIAFLDDDAVVSTNYVESIIEAFSTYNICGFRGRVLTKTRNDRNIGISHYDLGDIPVPSVINTEGNSAFRKDIYNEFGGMNPLLFGHEGLEFSYRISVKYGENYTIYWPKTVIYHDYANNDEKLKNKSIRHQLMKKYVLKKFPDIKKYNKRLKNYIIDENSKKMAELLIERKKQFII